MLPSGSKERERTFQPEILLFTDRDPRVPYDAANRTGLLFWRQGCQQGEKMPNELANYYANDKFYEMSKY